MHGAAQRVEAMENHLEPECACNLLSISPAAHYITYIVGISRAPQQYK